MPTDNLKLISLNIEKHHHVPIVLKFLKNENADVLCLQEIFEETFELFKKELDMDGVFCHQVVYKTDDGVAHSEGLAIFSHFPITDWQATPYTKVEEGTTSEILVKDLPEDNQDKNYINKQHHRKLLVAEIEIGEKKFRFATTHFTWAYYGKFDQENYKFVWNKDESTIDEQAEDATRLLDIIQSLKDMVFCADLNAPRGERVFDMFAGKLKDNIPPEYKTSIDEKIHRLGAPLPLMIDSVFTTKEYVVTDVVLKNGVSDHFAVVCEINRQN